MDLDAAAQSMLEAERLHSSGNRDRALEKLTQVEGLLLSSEMQDESRVLGVHMCRAAWLREAGRTDEAAQLLATIEDSVGAAPTDQQSYFVVALRIEQAFTAMRAGNFDDAEARLFEAKPLAETMAQNGSPAALAEVLANLSAVYYRSNRLDAAKSVLSEAARIDRETFNLGALSNDLNQLGLVAQARGDLHLARQYLGEALSVAIEAQSPRDAANAYVNIGVLLDLSGDIAGAREAYERAGAILGDAAEEADVASLVSNMAILAAEQGHYERAIKLLDEAKRRHMGQGDYVHAVHDLLSLAQAHLDLGESSQARGTAREAVAEAERLGLASQLWAGYFTLARAEAAYIRAKTPVVGPSELVQSYKTDVLANYDRAAHAVDLFRVGIGRPEERQDLLWNKEILYSEALLLAAILGLWDTALSYSERARARAFIDMLGSERISRVAGRHALTTKREELTARILYSDPDDRGCTQALVVELDELRDQVISEAPRIAAVTENDLPSLDRICASIPSDAALVEFYISEGGTHLTTFVLKQTGLSATNVSELGTADVGQLVDQLRAEIEYPSPDLQCETGRLLFYVLFQAIWDALDPSIHRLLIVPHRDLHRLPFASLWFSTADIERAYLSQRFALTILPSASVLPLLVEGDPSQIARGRALVLGNPTGDLDGAEVEASDVAALFGVEPVLRDGATRETLLHVPPGVSVIHVAAHGYFDEADPLLSGIVMADGVVTVDDLMEADMRIGLLTLSGCVTGASTRHPGDELIGLARGACFAGVQTVVTTLWETIDESSATMFARFYDALLHGMNKDEALSEAISSVRSAESHKSPLEWSPFVMMGDPRGRGW